MPARLVHTVKQNKRACVYGLICPVSMRVRYIGSSSHVTYRWQQHCNKPMFKKGKKWNWIKRLRSLNLRPIVFIIKEFDSDDEAFIYEKDLIRKHYHKLINQRNY